jgi:hypothetical protein
MIVPEKPSRALAQLQRDAALRRLRRVRRGALIGAAGLTGAIAAAVSAAAPGRSLSARAKAPSVTSKVTKSHAKMPPLASAGSLGLQGPAEAPQASARQPAPQSAPAQPSPAPSDQSQPAPSPAPAQPSAPAVSGGS